MSFIIGGMHDAPLDQIRESCEKLGIVNKTATWTRLSGGRSNKSWRVEATDDLVVKLFRPEQSSFLFANNAKLEWTCLTTFAHTGLAPEPVTNFEHEFGPVVVYRYISADDPSVSPFEAGRFLKHLHQTPPPAGLPKRSQDPIWITEVGGKFGIKFPKTDVAPTQAVLLHGDPVPANLISGETVCAIDWQCPAIGDPCDDIAIYLSPGMQTIYSGAQLSAHEEEAFWEGYNDPIQRERYERLRHIYREVFCAYFASKATAADLMALKSEEQSDRPNT